MNEEKINNDNIENNFQNPDNIKSKTTIAGICLIIAGALSILMWIGLASMDISIIETTIMPAFENLPSEYDSIAFNSNDIKDIFVICGSVSFFLSIFTILGGIMAFKKQMWGLALTGGILGLFTIGPLFVSSILSLIGIILVFISKKEFQ